MKSIREYAWAFALVASGCATLSGPRVREAVSGEHVVEVRHDVSCEEIAQRVYGDPGLGPQVCALANVAANAEVPGGTLLVLPARNDLEDRVAKERRAEELYRDGLEAADAGSFRVAADRFREALRLKPERTDILHNLGLALVRAGELEEATGVLEESAQRRPNDAEAHYALGSVLRKRGAHERALGEFQTALRLDSSNASAAFARARTLEDLGRTRDAERAWSDFLRRFPDDPWADRARTRLEELRNPAEPADS